MSGLTASATNQGPFVTSGRAKHARSQSSENGPTATPWERSRICTHGFVAGGYKNASPWRNVNRTEHSNDTSTNLGDKMNEAGSYIDGAFSDLHMYCYGTDNSFSGNTNRVWSMQMSNESSRGNQSGMNVSRNDCGCMIDYHYMGAHIYITGGGNSTTDRTNMKNDSNSTTNGFGSGGDYTAGTQGRLRGYMKTGGTAQYMTWANESWSTWSNSPGTNGWGKACGSWMGHFYMKTGGNCVTGLAKCNDDTGANISTFNVQNSGEENYQQGNFKGYCLGHYNGSQNNNSYKFSTTSDTYSSGGGGMEPKGHNGMSSAGNASAFSFNNSSYGITPPSY